MNSVAGSKFFLELQKNEQHLYLWEGGCCLEGSDGDREGMFPQSHKMIIFN